MMELELETLIRPPEFELRCNAFVREVLEIVAPKYPELEIFAQNVTLHTIEDLPRVLSIARKTAPEKDREKLIWLLRRSAARSDVLSSQENTAEIDIFGQRDYHRDQAEQAVNEVIRISIRYEPVITEQDIDLDSPDSPTAHLTFTFSAKQ